MGCKCDPGYEGHNCARRTCPKGDDPLTPNQVDMVQAVQVTGAPVEGYLTYFDPYGNAFTTGAITFSATAATMCTNIQDALRKLPNNVLNTVTVASSASILPLTRDSPHSTSDTGTTGAAVAASGTAPICLVKFRSEPGSTGYQHLMGCNVNVHSAAGQQPLTVGAAASTCTVYEVSPTASLTTLALTELAECSGRGLCDYSTGTCKCYSGHMGLACQKQEALVWANHHSDR